MLFCNILKVFYLIFWAVFRPILAVILPYLMTVYLRASSLNVAHRSKEWEQSREPLAVKPRKKQKHGEQYQQRVNHDHPWGLFICIATNKVENQRAEFRSVIQQGAVDELRAES